MKILHFIYDHINNPWVGGGGAVRAREICRRLKEKHQVTIVCGRYPGAEDSQEGNLSTCFVGTSRDNYVLSTFCYASTATQFLRKYAEDADIVIEDFAPYNPIFSNLSAGSKPVVLQVHHKEGINLIKRYQALGLPFMLTEMLYPRLFRNIICVSEESKKKFNIANAAVIPNGIDCKLFEITPSYNGPLLYLGRLHLHNKGLDTAVKAMSSAGSRLIIAGRGKDEQKVRSLVRSEYLSDKIEFAGHVSDAKKAELFASAGIVIVPSRYEGQGIVVLEAAACGKPVIVSDIPELRYAVDAGFGLSFRVGDAGDLAEKIQFLGKHEVLRKEMGLKGREYARNFTWDKVAGEYERYLTKIFESS